MARRVLLLPALAAALAIAAGCSSDPAGSTGVAVGSTEEAVSVDEIMARAQQWVDLAVPYCGGVRGGTDYICGGTCSRPSAAWNNFRTDCSGFVSWCWQIPDDPATGSFINDRSGPNGWSTVAIDALQTGDAIVCDGHIKLFSKFVSATSAEILEEYDCGKVARKAVQTFTRNGAHLTFSGDSRVYHPIHRNALTTPVVFPARVYASAHDVNGDGEADVCARGPGGVVCQRSNGTSFPDQVQGPPWSDKEGWAPDEYSSTVRFADVNGDGKADACARGFAGIECYVSDGTAFPTKIVGPAWSDPTGWNAPQYYRTIQLADVDGDGKIDVCGRDPKGIVCNLADGKGFPTEVRGPAWTDAAGWSDAKYYATIQLADVNGDGKADVCGRDGTGIVCAMSTGAGFGAEVRGPAWSDASGWSAPEYGATVRFVDVSGDGKADVCGRSKDGLLCALSTGNAFAAATAGPAWSDAAGWNKPASYSTIQFADINADGKLDVCARDANGIVCAPSTGAGFGAEVRGPAWGDAAGWNAPQYYETIGLADVNGDGKADVCGRSKTGITCAPSTGTGFGSAFDGPAWSDATGWSAAPYFGSVRYLGAALAPSGLPGGSSGGPGPTGGGTPAGGTPGGGDGTGTPSGNGGGPASSDPGGGGSSGCAIAARGTDASSSMGGLAALVGLALTARRRRPRV